MVTDTLHFFGSQPLYLELEKLGVSVTWVQEREGRIPIEDMLAAIVPGTDLVGPDWKRIELRTPQRPRGC
ncbi:MAG: hypothetical protein EP301_00750 [Gammaproteobacteria bacterium]|nr:MAG: hypothetical protein EP301_00750 [Gammaproteobacteria bacterium]